MTSPDVLGMPARRLGSGLVAFGVVGLIVTVILAVTWLAGLIALQDLDDQLEADRVAVATALANTAALMDSTATALEDVTGSMGNMGAALTDASDLLDRLASTTDSLATSLNVSILGQQPFAGAAENLESIAADLETFAGHSAALAEDLETLEPSLASLAGDLRTVQESVATLATRVEDFGSVERLVGFVRIYVLLSAALAVWLAVLAGGCIWAGRQLRRAAVTEIGETIPTS
jgi:hypothetical protein